MKFNCYVCLVDGIIKSNISVDQNSQNINKRYDRLVIIVDWLVKVVVGYAQI
jgi:hypothetical protein